MVSRPFRMNLQRISPAPCIRRRVAHKRLDSDDQPPAKCARLSVEAAAAVDAHGGLLLATSPGSPLSPAANPAVLPHFHHPQHQQGPSRIGAFLLLPLADRESSVHSAMDTDTGEELLCKVCAIGSLCNFSE